jgi:hypothetical protein
MAGVQMSFISVRWAVLKEALGVARYGLPSGVRAVLALATIGYVGWYGHVMSWLENVGIVGTAAFFLLFWVTLEFCLKLIIQIREARVEIAKLRKAGVELRNFGQRKITDQSTYDKWCADTLQWEKDVVAAIAKISAADAEWFATMDSYPAVPREPLVNPFYNLVTPHEARYAQHDFQLARLGEMIRDLWGRN